MKTHAESKPTQAPLQAQAMPTLDALAQKTQYCEAMCRAGVQPRLKIGAINSDAERRADLFSRKFDDKPVDGFAPATPYSQASLGPGTPLSDEHQELFKPHVGEGVDLDKMRIHRNQSPDEIGALAFACGNDIVLGPDRCSMQTLAHEVCHAADHQRVNGCTAQGNVVQCRGKPNQTVQKSQLEWLEEVPDTIKTPKELKKWLKLSGYTALGEVRLYKKGDRIKGTNEICPYEKCWVGKFAYKPKQTETTEYNSPDEITEATPPQMSVYNFPDEVIEAIPLQNLNKGNEESPSPNDKGEDDRSFLYELDKLLESLCATVPEVPEEEHLSPISQEICEATENSEKSGTSEATKNTKSLVQKGKKAFDKVKALKKLIEIRKGVRGVEQTADNLGGGIITTAGTIADAYFACEDVYNAPPQERGKVAFQEAFKIIGGMLGSILAAKILASILFAVGISGIITLVPFLLVVFVGAMIGTWAGKHLGGWIYDALYDAIYGAITEDRVSESPGDRVLESPAFQPYAVRVTTKDLNIRTGPGTNYGKKGSIKGGRVYTIIEEANGPGANKWGKLINGMGWISLDHTNRM